MTRPRLIGLTGSIGMGKSTTAKMFQEHGVALWDADAAVARLYEKGGAGVVALAPHFPQAVKDDAVDREVLRQIIQDNPEKLKEIEALIHPLVAADRDAFKTRAEADLLLFDIPLLFETGADAWLDTTIVVTVDAEIQKQRVLARPGMTEERFNLILSKQMPDAEKRARADHLIFTTSLESAAEQVANIITQLREGRPNA